MILHITGWSDWEEAQRAGEFRAPSLDTDGFIHCSTPAPEQVIAVANALYRGQRNLVLLCIDPDKLSSPLVFEDCYDSGQAPHGVRSAQDSGQSFPHVYGPVNLAAVVNVCDFSPLPDGTFELPPTLLAFQKL